MTTASPSQPAPEQLTAELAEITRRAGAAILEIYDTDFEVRHKSDASPVTEADLAAHEVIASALHALTPEIPLLSEESTPPAYAERRHWRRYWLIDPLDGTREFINRNGEFTVNIALIENGSPSLGCVGVPTGTRSIPAALPPAGRSAMQAIRYGKSTPAPCRKAGR